MPKNWVFGLSLSFFLEFWVFPPWVFFTMAKLQAWTTPATIKVLRKKPVILFINPLTSNMTFVDWKGQLSVRFSPPLPDRRRDRLTPRQLDPLSFQLQDLRCQARPVPHLLQWPPADQCHRCVCANVNIFLLHWLGPITTACHQCHYYLIQH